MFRVLGPGQIYLEIRKDLDCEYKVYFGLGEIVNKSIGPYMQTVCYRVYTIKEIDGEFMYQSGDCNYVEIPCTNIKEFLSKADYYKTITEFSNYEKFIDQLIKADKRIIVIISLTYLVLTSLLLCLKILGL